MDITASNTKKTPKRAKNKLVNQFGMIGPMERSPQRKTSDRPNTLTAKESNARIPKNTRSAICDHRNFGGADRDRTGGLLVANQALSQLSYSPMTAASSFEPRASSKTRLLIARSSQLEADLVGLGRIELPTSPLSGVRSSHLSYRPG